MAILVPKYIYYVVLVVVEDDAKYWACVWVVCIVILQNL